jgi:hypothetical protein
LLYHFVQTAIATPILTGVGFDRSCVQNVSEHCQDAWELLDGRAKPIVADLDDEDLLTPYYRSLAHAQLALLGLRLMRTQGIDNLATMCVSMGLRSD